MKNYYDILGVDKKATTDQVKKAYRDLAKKYHPDQAKDNPKAEERFKEASEAYQTLSDPSKRSQYDSMQDMRSRGFTGYEGMGDIFGGRGKKRPGGRQAGGFRFEDLGSFRDMFGSFFDPGGVGGFGEGGGSAAARGQDRNFTIEIGFDEALRGSTTSIRVPGSQPCGACSGTGARPGSSPAQCESCGGSGKIVFQQGSFSTTRPCPTCFGRGTKINDPCNSCRGSGFAESTRTLQVKIPQGVKDGARIRLKGEGDPGAGGGPPGDLYLHVKVGKSMAFESEGDDIKSNVSVPFSTAALGGSVEVRTFWGAVTLRVPAGVKCGSVMRLKGQGVRREEGKAGDHLATVMIEVPPSPSPEQKEAIERLRKAGL